MPSIRRRRLDKPRRYRGQRAGLALVAWLNDHSRQSWLKEKRWKQKILEEMLEDATEIFRHFPKYPKATNTESEKRYWEHLEKLNERLLSHTHALKVDPNEFYEGNTIRWTMTEDSPLAALSSEVGWFIELIEQGVILRIRKCQQCSKWYFARFSHQEFCSGVCRAKRHAGTEAFKERRRKYMRDYYRLKQSGKVK